MTERKVTRRKKVARKAAPKTVFEMLEGSIVGTPIRIANKTFLASLGLVSTMQTELVKFQSNFEKSFEKTFEKLVKDGEKARARYRAGFEDLREDVSDFGVDVAEDIVEAKDRVVDNLRSAVAD